LITMTASVSPGYDAAYLTAQVGRGGEHYYLKAIEQAGEPPGIWLGDGAEFLGLSGEIDNELMSAMYAHLTDPRRFAESQTVMDARWREFRKAHPELKAGTDAYREARAAVREEVRAEFRLGTKPYDYSKSTEKAVQEAVEALPAGATPEQIRQAEMRVRQNAKSARTFTDVTFSVPKSVSLLHAGLQVEAARLRAFGDIAGAEAAQAKADAVWGAVMKGNKAMLGYLQEHAGYAREGRFAGGTNPDGTKAVTTGRRVDAHKWTVASFRQHLSRDEDPQLHVHNAIWRGVNIWQTDPITGKTTEKWLTIDAEGIYTHAKAAGHIAERVMFEALIADVGVAVEWRPDGKSMEVLGISQELRDQYSKRARTVREGVKELVQQYKDKYDRAPGAHQLAKMSQFVVLAERKGKQEAIPREQLLERWEAEAVREVRESLSGVPAAVAQAAAERGLERELFQPEQVVERALESVQAQRSAWHRSDLVVEITKALPACLGGLDAEQIMSLVDDLTGEALRQGTATGKVVALEAPQRVPVPPSLTRENGESVYSRHGATLYVTDEQLAREQRLVDAAERLGGRTIDPGLVEEAVVEAGLDEYQAAAVRGIATDGHRLNRLVGPAGAGKSRTTGALAKVWQKDTGVPAFGLAPSQAAADVLRDEGVPLTANVPSFLTYHEQLISQGVSNSTVDQFRLRPGQLVIVDESSMAQTDDLHKVWEIVEKAGAKLLLVGDPAQLDAVGAGGIYSELVERKAGTYELGQARRFQEEWEGPASLRLRKGDADVLREYDVHGRIRSGTREEMVELAYQNWIADHLAGRNAVLITSTNQNASELAMRVREDLIRLGKVQDGKAVKLGQDGAAEASRGDQVHLREIDRSIVSASGRRYAKNHDVAEVIAVGEDQSLTVRYADGDTMTLPPEYVKQKVELAYAGTFHSVQGRTVEVAHTLATPDMSREHLYVGMSRASGGNYAYIQTDPPGSLMSVKRGVETGEAEELAEPMAVLRGILENTSARPAAITTLREELERAERLDTWTPELEEIATRADDQVLRQALADTAGTDFYEQVVAEADGKVWNSVVRKAREAWVKGHDGAEMLRQAVTMADFKDAKSLGKVLHWRLKHQLERADAHRVQQDQAAVEAARVAQTQQAMEAAVAQLRVQAENLTVMDQQQAADYATALQSAPSLNAGGEEQERARLAEQRRAEAEERSTWRSRLERAQGEERDYALRVVEEVVDPRERELGRQLAEAEERPQWADRLGPVPEDPIEREQWIERAGRVAGYREAHGYTNERDAIGPAPKEGAVDVHTDWQRAYRALGEPEDRMELVGMTDAQLAEQVERYRREEAWAPAYVAEQLRETVRTQRDMERDAAQLRVQAAGSDDRAQARELRDQAEGNELLAERLSDEAKKLHKVHDARNAWHEHTTETRERAQQARRELEMRQGQPEQQPQQVDQDQPQAAAEGPQPQQRLTGEDLGREVDRAVQAQGILAEREQARAAEAAEQARRQEMQRAAEQAQSIERSGPSISR
jgi:hypothetical protein